MATAKQLAALKKARAARKKNLLAKKNPSKKRRSKKRVGTSTTKRSLITKKTPTKRLKKRRAKNTKTGYYPNPSRKGRNTKYIIKLVVGRRSIYYVRPGVFETVRSKATPLSETGAAQIAKRLFERYKNNTSLRSISTEKK